MIVNRLPVSVCIAVYNGEKYLNEQIHSIIMQLDNNEDEIIIINDFSNDNSIEIIKSFNDSRIKLYNNINNIGFVKSFELAIQKSKNSVIFLSDQDDIWLEDRLDKMYFNLKSGGKLLLCSNFQGFNEFGNYIQRFKKRLKLSDSNKSFKNIISIFKGDIPYFGCTMVFESELKKYILPFPTFIPTHDLWIAIMGNVINEMFHLEDDTLLHRIHGCNLSFVNRGLFKKIYTRFLFLKMVLVAIKRNNL